MNEFGYIFCRDVHDYNSGPVGSVMLQFDKRWKMRHQVAQQVGQEGKKDENGEGRKEDDGKRTVAKRAMEKATAKWMGSTMGKTTEKGTTERD